MIGDRSVDTAAGHSAGLRTIIVRSGAAGEDKILDVKPDFVFNNLSEAVNHILTGAKVAS
jgi:phosphoglycolate phosphatase-like HAD superfamily hydrolase